jgi:hypothetical protein
VTADPRILQALLAGLITGMAVALATTAIALIAIARNPRWREQPLSLPIPLPAAGVIVVNAMVLGWTVGGLVLGAIFLGIEDRRPSAGLGSANLVFTAVVAGGIVTLLAAGAYVRGRVTWPVLSTAGVAALAFGWLLPLLATIDT